MSESLASLLKGLWPELESNEYTSLEFELPLDEREILSNVFEERKVSCVICGRADFMNFEYRFSFIKKSPVSIHAYCQCGNRVGYISKASVFCIPKKKQPLPITLEDFLKQIKDND